jgi:hypothetical protein
MNRKCQLCDKPLTGGTDTFGWPGDWCWDCWQLGIVPEEKHGNQPEPVDCQVNYEGRPQLQTLAVHL